LGETFLLEIAFLEVVFWVSGFCLELGSAGALPLPLVGVWAGETWGEPCPTGGFPISLAGELFGDETISSISVGYYSKGPVDLEV